MGQDLFRIPVRFDLKNPEHARIVSFLREVSKPKGSTMSGFIIEALSYYIKVISKNGTSGKVSRPGEGDELLTRHDLERRLKDYENEIKGYLMDTILPLISGRRVRIENHVDDDTSDTVYTEKADIASDPDIMSSINSWIE